MSCRVRSYTDTTFSGVAMHSSPFYHEHGGTVAWFWRVQLPSCLGIAGFAWHSAFCILHSVSPESASVLHVLPFGTSTPVCERCLLSVHLPSVI